MRVKYYNATDLSIGFQLDRAAEIAINFRPSRKRYDINEIIELQNVTKFIESGIYSSNWDSTYKSHYTSAKLVLFKAIESYFKAISKTNVNNKFKGIEPGYANDFIDLFLKYKLDSVISERRFLNILKANSIGIALLIRNRDAINMYPDLARKLILARPKNAELIISKYLASNDKTDKTINLPNSLTDDEKLALIVEYIDSADPNINYLQLVVAAHRSEGLSIPDKIKVKAKHKLESESERIFKDSTGMPIGYEISFSDTQEQDKSVDYKDGTTKVTYKKSWFEENLDYPTILNNFIYLFEYADSKMMITLASFKADLGVFERFMGVPAKSGYKTGVSFDAMDMFSTGALALYYELLLSYKIRFEEVIEWFFSTYVTSEFRVSDFHFSMPSASSTYLEKCSYIFPAMESALKQFQIYATDGHIDQELVRISSDQIKYKNIPSLTDKKYIYLSRDNDEAKMIMNLLFSDQSGLGYLSENKKEDTFYELIQKDRVKVTEFQSYQASQIDLLKRTRIIRLNNGIVEFRSQPQIQTLNYLFHREAINYHRASAAERKEIDLMLKKGYLRVGNTLLSEAEADYFNYHLNKKEFGNGLDLKNQYSHGTPPLADNAGAKVFRHHYLIGMKLMVLLLIKINDELCIKDEGL